MKNLEKLFYNIRDDKNSDLFKGLEKILESKDSWWNYRCASMCIKDKRISAEQRHVYAIRHAEILFENNDFELIVRFLDKVDRKPAYQQYIKSKDRLFYYRELQKKHLQEQADAQLREEQRKERELNFLNSIPYVEELTEQQEYSRLVFGAKTLEEKSFLVAEARMPYFSYKYIKEVLKTTGLSQEIKKALVMPHAEFVFASGNKEVITKLEDFLQYKPLYKEYVEQKQKTRVRVPQE